MDEMQSRTKQQDDVVGAILREVNGVKFLSFKTGVQMRSNVFASGSLY